MSRYPERNDPRYYDLHNLIDALEECNAKLIAAMKETLDMLSAGEGVTAYNILAEAIAQNSAEKP